MDDRSVTIRELVDDDADEAVRVINDAARWYAQILPPDEVPDPEMTRDQWRDEHRRMIFYGAEVDGSLVGVIGLEYIADVALLRHWYVDPARQRLGIGTLLRVHAEREVVGVDRIVAGTYAANVKARRALEAVGYQLSADPDTVLRTYYDIPDRRRVSSVTYERVGDSSLRSADRPEHQHRLSTERTASTSAGDYPTSPADPTHSELPSLPVGFHRFHRSRFLNYQLNRFHSLGFMRHDDLVEVAGRIRSFEDWVREFTRLATESEADGRLANAAFAHRAAEFLATPGDARKRESYERFIDLFDRSIVPSVATAVTVERLLVPFGNGALPVLRLSPRSEQTRGATRGTVVVHGGFDSLIEEFFAMLLALTNGGYDVVAFEGPGQGAALRRHEQLFDHDWEKPTGAVLDHLDLSGVTLLGISMGGYWCLRSAAFEPRIERVIVMASVFDWLAQLPAPARRVVRALVRRRRFMNAAVRARMRLFPILRHAIEQCLMQIDGDEPIDAVDWLLKMNATHQQPERVYQDVLLMHGLKDRFQPVSLHRAQRDALVNARSVTERLFTEAEHAASHCQMGNLGLAVEVILDWLAAHTTRES